MKNIAKKMVIYTMVGMLQIGFGAAVTEASALHTGYAPSPMQERENKPQHDRHEQERGERRRQENERHEREMKRRPHESEQEWHKRQKIETERHDKALREIAALVIGIAIGSATN